MVLTLAIRNRIFMTKDIELAAQVLLIDATSFNEVLRGMKRFTESHLQRTLSDVHVEEWVSCLLLDAGIRPGAHRTDVLFVYDERCAELAYTDPAKLREELNGVAISTSMGELVFTSVSSEELVSREHLYMDLLAIALNNSSVKHLMLFPSMQEYGEQLLSVLREEQKTSSEEKTEVTIFGMECPAGQLPCRWESVGYSVMHSFGVNPDELR